MKTTIFPIAAISLLVASCSTETKDSYQTVLYPECNLIIDNYDASQLAQVSTGRYEVKFNLSRYCIDINTSDLIVNNQKMSFETDTMALHPKTYSYTFNGKDEVGTKLTFFKNGKTGITSIASDLSGSFVVCYYRTGDVTSPNYTLGGVERLDLRYTLSDRYSVQTFWPTALYCGQTVASSGSDTYATKGSDYLTQIDFDKKTASVYVYNPEFSSDREKTLPKVILFEEIPVVFTHEGFSLESASPKTKVLGKKNNLAAMVDSVGFAATDFSLFLTSSDLTDVSISYKLDGKNVNFHGTSTLKSGF